MARFVDYALPPLVLSVAASMPWSLFTYWIVFYSVFLFLSNYICIERVKREEEKSSEKVYTLSRCVTSGDLCNGKLPEHALSFTNDSSPNMNYIATEPTVQREIESHNIPCVIPNENEISTYNLAEINPKNAKVIKLLETCPTDIMMYADCSMNITESEFHSMYDTMIKEHAILGYAVPVSFLSNNDKNTLDSIDLSAIYTEIAMNATLIPRFYFFATRFLGLTVATDKLAAFHAKRFLQEAPLHLYKNYLNGDSAVAKRLEEFGKRIIQFNFPVLDIIGARDMKSVEERFKRWAIMRKNFVPWFFYIEPMFCMSFNIIACLLFTRSLVLTALVAFLLFHQDYFILTQFQHYFKDRARPVTRAELLLGIISREPLIWKCYFNALFAKTVSWRGKKCMIMNDGGNTRFISISSYIEQSKPVNNFQ